MRGYVYSVQEREAIAIQGATLMVNKDFTLWDISDYINIPMSTVYRFMMEELPRINCNIYKQVLVKIQEHKRRGGKHRW